MIIKVITLDYDQSNERECKLRNELTKFTFNTKNISSKYITKIINFLKNI